MKSSISFHRKILYWLARTPIAKMIKVLLRLRFTSAVQERKKLANGLSSDAQLCSLIEEFNRNGYCRLDGIVDPAILEEVALAAAKKYKFAERASKNQEAHRKDFWTRLLDEDKVNGALPTDNPFVAFALQPKILTFISKVCGELPFLDDVLLVLSRHTGKKLSLSQLWHYDYDDTRTIKLYIYLSDVKSIDDGPFTFLPAPVSKRLGRSLRSRRQDKEIISKVGDSEIVKLVSPRLSVFIVETSRCLHMGSRVEEGHERLMYMASYITIPRLYPEPHPRFKLTGMESEVIRSVLTPAKPTV